MTDTDPKRVCNVKGVFMLGDHTEVTVECGQRVEGHGEYHAAGKTLKTGEDGAPDAIVLFRWRDEPKKD